MSIHPLLYGDVMRILYLGDIVGEKYDGEKFKNLLDAEIKCEILIKWGNIWKNFWKLSLYYFL